jgi:hypothetical protein
VRYERAAFDVLDMRLAVAGFFDLFARHSFSAFGA